MAKNKKFDFKLISIIGGSIVGLGIIWGTIVKAVDFTRWPEVTTALAGQVAEVKGDVIDLKKYVAEQQKANEINQKANELLEQKLQQQYQNQQQLQQPYCEVSEGVLWCWDSDTQQWYKVSQ